MTRNLALLYKFRCSSFSRKWENLL